MYLAAAPDYAHYFPFLQPLAVGSDIGSGASTGLAAAVAACVFIGAALGIVHCRYHSFSIEHVLMKPHFADANQLSHSVSISGRQIGTFKTTFWILTIIALIWLFTIGAVLFAMGAFNTGVLQSAAVANGAIYMSAFALMLIMNVAVIFPALLLLQPIRLWRVLRAEREAVTPRQRFRGQSFTSETSVMLLTPQPVTTLSAIYPRTYDPTYATGCCVLAVLLASAFSLIFPLLAPGALVLLFLTLIGTFDYLKMSMNYIEK